MKEKLKSYLEQIAVMDHLRYDAITSLLDSLGIRYEIQEKTWESKSPIYEKVKKTAPTVASKQKKNAKPVKSVVAKQKNSVLPKKKKKAVGLRAQSAKTSDISATHEKKITVIKDTFIRIALREECTPSYILECPEECWEDVSVLWNVYYKRHTDRLIEVSCEAVDSVAKGITQAGGDEAFEQYLYVFDEIISPEPEDDELPEYTEEHMRAGITRSEFRSGTTDDYEAEDIISLDDEDDVVAAEEIGFGSTLGRASYADGYDDDYDFDFYGPQKTAYRQQSLFDQEEALFDDDNIFLEGRYGNGAQSSFYPYGYGYGSFGANTYGYGYGARRTYSPKIIGYNTYEESVKNIVIPLSDYASTDGKKIVFMAHYDAVGGSTGANDNGSAVAILIAFAEIVMAHGSTIPMEIVFTDREESGAYGSTMYNEISGKDILEIINLDTCGVGEDIVTCDWSLHPSEISWNLIYHEELKNLRPVFVRSLPYCDADVMHSAGHHVTGICSLPRKDVLTMMTGKTASYAETYKYMHNGACDDIKFINYEVMDKIVQYLSLLL